MIDINVDTNTGASLDASDKLKNALEFQAMGQTFTTIESSLKCSQTGSFKELDLANVNSGQFNVEIDHPFSRAQLLSEDKYNPLPESFNNDDSRFITKREYEERVFFIHKEPCLRNLKNKQGSDESSSHQSCSYDQFNLNNETISNQENGIDQEKKRKAYKKEMKVLSNFLRIFVQVVLDNMSRKIMVYLTRYQVLLEFNPGEGID